MAKAYFLPKPSRCDRCDRELEARTYAVRAWERKPKRELIFCDWSCHQGYARARVRELREKVLGE